VVDEGDTDSSSSKWPEFPTAGTEASVLITREATFRAWVGRSDRLVALEREIERALKSAYEDLQVAEGGRGYPIAAIQSLQLRNSVAGNEGRMTRSGSMAAILAETDFREIENVSMENFPAGDHYPRISLQLSLKSDSNSRSVRLKVTGRDRQWVGGVFDVLAAEVRKGVPNWAPMRSPLVGALLGFLCALGISGVLMATRQRGAGNDLATAVILSALLGPMGGFLVFNPLLEKLFPGLEVIEPGEADRGRRTLGFAFAALSVLLAIAGVVLGIMAL